MLNNFIQLDSVKNYKYYNTNVINLGKISIGERVLFKTEAKSSWKITKWRLENTEEENKLRGGRFAIFK